MKIFYPIVLLFILCVSLQGQTLAPELISSSGSYIEGPSADLCFSIGEVVTGTLSKTEGTINQGFQQGIEVLTSVENKNHTSEITVFPVPAKNSIIINLQGKSGMNAFLFNLEGKEIVRKELSNTETHIDLSSLLPGLYILKIKDEAGSFLQSFEIIKL